MADFRLKVFQCVAKNLSFTKASQELYVSQPAITKHIKELESTYHTRLFRRSGNKISLTDAGHLLLEYTNKILAEYNKLEYEMNLLNNEYMGELNLGASTTIAQYVLPDLLAQYIKKFPKVKLTLLNENSREIESALEEGRIDLGLVEGVYRSPNMRYTHFLNDELVAVVNTNNHLVQSDQISLDTLKRIPLVLRERGSGTLDVFERTLKEKNIKLSDLQVMMYVGSTESIKRLLESTDYMGVVSVRSVTRELSAGILRVVDIKELTMFREFNFIQLQGEERGIADFFMKYASRYNL